MLRAVEQIDWVRDESMVVDRLKTGELPPPDIQVCLMQARSPLLISNFHSSSLIFRVFFSRKKSYLVFPFQFQDMSDTRSDRERKSSSLSRRISRYYPSLKLKLLEIFVDTAG